MTSQERAESRAQARPMFDMPIDHVCAACGKVICVTRLMPEGSDEQEALVRALGAKHRKSECWASNN